MTSDNNILTYKFHWSVEIIVITFIGLSIVIGCLTSMFYSNAVPSYLKWIIGCVVILPVLYIATWIPINLSANTTHIILHKLIGKITIPIGEITSVQIIDKSMISNSIRLFGSGGVFGYLGKFRNRLLGNYIMYITERKNLILIKTHKKTYIFNCKGPDSLIMFVNSKNN